MVRMGFSKDIHRLGLDRKLMVGGVHVPYHMGEIAHSDGDVVYHAIAEAVLGALALGDLGTHFPDSDRTTENMDSAVIMNAVYRMMRIAGFEIGNIDVFISLEQPKLKPYIEQIQRNVCNLMHAGLDRVSIKAGTNEGMGPVGQGLAIEAYAVVTLESI